MIILHVFLSFVLRSREREVSSTHAKMRENSNYASIRVSTDVTFISRFKRYWIVWFIFFKIGPHVEHNMYPHWYTDHCLLKSFLDWFRNKSPKTVWSYYINHALCCNFKPFVEVYFTTNPKMVLMNNDQCINADTYCVTVG